MRIIQIVSNKSWGGGERYALDLCSTLSGDGHEVEVVTRGEECVDKPFRERGIRVSRLPLGGELDIISPIRLARKLRRDPNRRILIHVHNFKDASTAIKARTLASGGDKDIRIVCTRHLAKAGKTGVRGRNLYKALDAIVFVSEFAKRAFLESDPEADISRLHVIRNSIIPGTSSRTGVSGKPADGKLHLMYMGRIVEEKGLETLFEAMEKCSDLPLELDVCGVGTGPYVKNLKGDVWRRNLTDRVNWLGHVDNVYEKISGADIGVVPSKWKEPFGLVLLEFMSQGVPVISTDNGAQPEIIRSGGEGLLVPPEDADSMADAIRRLASDPALRRSTGDNGRLRYERDFTYPRFYREMISLYNSLFRAEFS